MLSFTVAGLPKPQPRAKAARIGGFIRLYTPYTKDAKDWRSAVIAAALPFAAQVSGAAELRLHFALPRPKAHFLKAGLRPDAPAYPIARPDTDNLAKLVMDALTEAGVWPDDCVVCSTHIHKRYADGTTEPGCIIQIDPLP